MLCRCFVYCAGSLPPGMVICADLFFLWPWFACAAVLGVNVVCMCSWLCMCRCMCWLVCRCSAWAVAYVIRVQLPGILWSLYLYDCRSLLHRLFFVRHCVCTFSPFFFFFFFFFLSPMYNFFESITSRHVNQWRWLVNDGCLTVSVTMNSDGLQGGFYDAVWLVAFVLGWVT